MKRATYAVKRHSSAGQRKRYVPSVVFSGASREEDFDRDVKRRALILLNVGRVARISRVRAPTAVMMSSAKTA